MDFETDCSFFEKPNNSTCLFIPQHKLVGSCLGNEFDKS